MTDMIRRLYLAGYTSSGVLVDEYDCHLDRGRWRPTDRRYFSGRAGSSSGVYDKHVSAGPVAVGSTRFPQYVAMSREAAVDAVLGGLRQRAESLESQAKAIRVAIAAEVDREASR